VVRRICAPVDASAYVRVGCASGGFASACASGAPASGGALPEFPPHAVPRVEKTNASCRKTRRRHVIAIDESKARAALALPSHAPR
jgi:hypothetical protein